MKKTIFLVAILSFIFFVNGKLYSCSDDEDDDHNKIENYNGKVDYFNKSAVIETKFAPVYIDNIKIESPKSIIELKQYLKNIEENVAKKANGDIIFKYGDMPELRLKAPYLGIGKHGMVFEIIDKDSKINKVFKLNFLDGLNALNSGIAEYENYQIWQEESVKYSFTVAKLHEYHPFGLFSIKTKNKGISLTKMLMQLGLIYVVDNNKPTTAFKKLTDEELQKPQIKQIFTAVFDMLSVIKGNTNYSTSLSPNNIFIEFEEKTNIIKKIELIDYGKRMSKRKEYLAIEHANQYLAIAADRLEKYIIKNYIL